MSDDPGAVVPSSQTPDPRNTEACLTTTTTTTTSNTDSESATSPNDLSTADNNSDNHRWLHRPSLRRGTRIHPTSQSTRPSSSSSPSDSSGPGSSAEPPSSNTSMSFSPFPGVTSPSVPPRRPRLLYSPMTTSFASLRMPSDADFAEGSPPPPSAPGAWPEEDPAGSKSASPALPPVADASPAESDTSAGLSNATAQSLFPLGQASSSSPAQYQHEQSPSNVLAAAQQKHRLRHRRILSDAAAERDGKRLSLAGDEGMELPCRPASADRRGE